MVFLVIIRVFNRLVCYLTLGFALSIDRLSCSCNGKVKAGIQSFTQEKFVNWVESLTEKGQVER